MAARISSSSMLWASPDSAPARVEITTVSVPEPPEMIKLPMFARSPRLMTKRSAPAPPEREEALPSAFTSIVSLPRPPTRVFTPAPPIRLSLPAPPKRLSLPPPPTRMSLPAPPLMVSFPPPPLMELFEALPVMLLDRLFPEAFAIVPPSMRFSTFAARL